MEYEKRRTVVAVDYMLCMLHVYTIHTSQTAIPGRGGGESTRLEWNVRKERKRHDEKR